MKEQIYTIPVHDAFNEPSECPFCAMQKKLEDNTVEYVLSPSYMEVDVRGETNRLGFCQRHMERLYKEGSSLGVGLMLHSHLKAQHETINELLKTASGKKKLFAKKDDTLSELESYRLQFKKSCYVCSRAESTFERYVKAFFTLYKKEAGFKDQVFSNKGYCLDHFMMIYEKCTQELGAADAEEFRAKLSAMEDENLKTLEDDVEWFTRKFDYRFAKEPWKNSKDALPRAIQKVNSQFVEK